LIIGRARRTTIKPFKNKDKKDASLLPAISLWALLLLVALLTLLSLLPLRSEVAEVILLFSVLFPGLGLAGVLLVNRLLEPRSPETGGPA
jgi:hypothetical protein